MKQKIIIVLVVIIAVLLAKNFLFSKKELPPTNFAECIAQNNIILETYPEQCKTKDGKTFVNDIGNELEKVNLIMIESPRPNATIESPLTITGQARGYWFFEASFPITLLDANGKELVTGIAEAQGEWMTEEFVPFKAVLTFGKPDTKTGKLLLKKDNPSGLPENEDVLIVPVVFK